VSAKPKVFQVTAGRFQGRYGRSIPLVDWFSSDSFDFERSMYIESGILGINKIGKVRWWVRD